jgi:hypothetical protein
MDARNRRAVAIVAAVGAWIASFRFLYWVLLLNNWDPVQVYRHRSLLFQSFGVLERLVFLPTYWLTKALGRIAEEGGWLGLMTLAEICLLSLLYAGIVFAAVDGRLRRAWDRWLRRRVWVFVLLAIVLFGLGFLPGGTTW